MQIIEQKKLIKLAAVAVLVISAIAIFYPSGNREVDNSSQDNGSVSTVAGGVAAKTLAKKLYLEGLNLYQFRQLSQAISKFEMALLLWPDHTASKIKLASAKNELKKLIESNYSLGLAEFNALHYGRAVQAWQRVITVLNDKDEELYKRSEENIKLALARMKEGGI